MDLQGSPRLTLIYHCGSAFLLSCLLLPGVLGTLLVADPDRGLPLLLLAVTSIQAGTLWWFNRTVASNFNPKQVSAETYSRCATVFLLSIFALHVTLVLFGAPLLEDLLETFYLACFIALLTSLPIAVCTECTAFEIDRLFFRRRPDNICERSLLYVVSCTLMGCWLGALPIPLDWDAPWQRWPLTCVMASIGGGIAGHVAHAVKTVLEGRPEPKGTPKGKNIRA